MENITLFVIYINIVVGIVNLANLNKETRFFLRWLIAIVSGANFLIVIVLICQYAKATN